MGLSEYMTLRLDGRKRFRSYELLVRVYLYPQTLGKPYANVMKLENKWRDQAR